MNYKSLQYSNLRMQNNWRLAFSELFLRTPNLKNVPESIFFSLHGGNDFYKQVFAT